jgi:hypothetical protein
MMFLAPSQNTLHRLQPILEKSSCSLILVTSQLSATIMYMKYLILHHVLYIPCKQTTNISTFMTASSRYCNFALSCANSDRPKDMMPTLPTTYKQKENLSNICIIIIITIITFFISSYRSLHNDNGLVKKHITTEITKA